MPQYTLISAKTELDAKADLASHTADGWKPMLLSTAAATASTGKVEVHIIVILEK